MEIAFHLGNSSSAKVVFNIRIKVLVAVAMKALIAFVMEASNPPGIFLFSVMGTKQDLGRGFECCGSIILPQINLSSPK